MRLSSIKSKLIHTQTAFLKSAIFQVLVNASCNIAIYILFSDKYRLLLRHYMMCDWSRDGDLLLTTNTAGWQLVNLCLVAWSCWRRLIPGLLFAANERRHQYHRRCISNALYTCDWVVIEFSCAGSAYLSYLPHCSEANEMSDWFE